MKNPVKKPSWWEEFKTFAVKGNAMALAVGTIIGGAFSTITKSLTNDIIMPVVNIFLGGADFTQIKIRLPRMPWVEGQGRYERYDILFDPQAHGVEGVELLPEGLEVVNLVDDPIAADIFRRCDLYRQSCLKETFSKLLPHLLSELFYHLHTTLGSGSATEGARLSPLISDFLRYETC